MLCVHVTRCISLMPKFCSGYPPVPSQCVFEHMCENSAAIRTCESLTFCLFVLRSTAGRSLIGRTSWISWACTRSCSKKYSASSSVTSVRTAPPAARTSAVPEHTRGRWRRCMAASHVPGARVGCTQLRSCERVCWLFTTLSAWRQLFLDLFLRYTLSPYTGYFDNVSQYVDDICGSCWWTGDAMLIFGCELAWGHLHISRQTSIFCQVRGDGNRDWVLMLNFFALWFWGFWVVTPALDMSSSDVAAVAHAGAGLRATMMRVKSACLCEAQRILSQFVRFALLLDRNKAKYGHPVPLTFDGWLSILTFCPSSSAFRRSLFVHAQRTKLLQLLKSGKPLFGEDAWTSCATSRIFQHSPSFCYWSFWAISREGFEKDDYWCMSFLCGLSVATFFKQALPSKASPWFYLF